jgi:hypothetical protein
MNLVNQIPYVRLSPTVLFRVPDCYGLHKAFTGYGRCWLCAVKKQCVGGQRVELVSISTKPV